jgi:predicted membrane-bound spermidine synthase
MHKCLTFQEPRAVLTHLGAITSLCFANADTISARMLIVPVLVVLIFNLVVFLGDLARLGKGSDRRHTLLLSVLFFCSGMPALIYQIVWQRVLFSIYGVNAESVAIIVSAFMLGLGLGSLAGGWASCRFPKQAIILFGACELTVATLGLISLPVFHWAARFSAGASLPVTVVFGLLLLLPPTMLMGATLPLLVQNFVGRSHRVGFSVATLYFVNTFGSAVASYLCAVFLLRDLGQRDSVLLAASVNAVVGLTAFFFGRHEMVKDRPPSAESPAVIMTEPSLSIGAAMLIAGLAGFVALGFEIAWFRVFALASQDRAPAFALLLSTYLAGIAAGSYISDKLTENQPSESVAQLVGTLLLVAGAGSVYLPPLVALFEWKGLPFINAAPAFFIIAALIGSVFPLLCRIAVPAGVNSGSHVSWTYASNILGSTLGSLFIGFFWMHHFGLKSVSVQLSLIAIFTGTIVVYRNRRSNTVAPKGAPIAVVASLLAVAVASTCYSRLFEKLIFGPRSASETFAHVIENRNGVIAITGKGAVYGNGVYDGYFNVDPHHDVNSVVRAYALSYFHPSPKRMLMIGLSSGSWAQILANHPLAESLDIIEINPGYLELIPQYPSVASLLDNPRVRIYLDDGRRWLLAHPNARYDAIVMNTSFYWRDHTSDILSADFLKIVRRHLSHGGIFYYNTTGSEDVAATGLSVFPYGLRVLNFLVVSDSPIDLNEARWISALRQYKIDDQLVFEPTNPMSAETLDKYTTLANALDKSTDFQSIETSKSLNTRLGKRSIITDDNMGWEWR